MSTSKPIPALTDASEWVLAEIIRLTEDNELDVSKSSAWAFAYPYKQDSEGNAFHKNINIRNDKSTRELLDYLRDNKLITVSQTIEQKYVPDNVKLTASYKYIYAFEFVAKDVQRLKSFKAKLTVQIKVGGGATYDHQSGLITINGKTTLIKGKKQRQLLEILFRSERSRRKRWGQDEIREQLDSVRPESIKVLWPYYTAKNINKSLSGSIHINDLLDATMITVRINPKYLL